MNGVQHAVGVLALVPHVLGSLSAWISNEFGIGVAPLNGIVVALVLARWFSARSANS
ncbi:hypothetical protein [Brachybacterium paraconglomeratum]|uniref:hypothetical protein n=1 Tax=Brachybacterium paraconglomeratum TaxID=173362 RepID=UPI0031E84D5B